MASQTGKVQRRRSVSTGIVDHRLVFQQSTETINTTTIGKDQKSHTKLNETTRETCRLRDGALFFRRCRVPIHPRLITRDPIIRNHRASKWMSKDHDTEVS
jgi:hypothetical protein